jgi:hypothetical protein
MTGACPDLLSDSSSPFEYLTTFPASTKNIACRLTTNSVMELRACMRFHEEESVVRFWKDVRSMDGE